MKTIAITGAAGYIGRHVVTELVRGGGARVKVLRRSRESEIRVGVGGAGIEVVEGDLREPESLREFLEAGCTVVNFVYLWGAGEAQNLTAIETLLEACRAANIGRLIHCSTAAVVGRA